MVKINFKNILLIIFFVIFLFVFSSIFFNDYFENNINKSFTQNENIVKNNPERFSIKKLSDNTTVRIYNLTAKEGYYEYIDGKKTFVYSYNNLIPGPILRGRVGDTIIVNFYNDLYENSTVHWHGLEINNSADGVPFVTQNPVPPKSSFIYKFKLKNPGVYWYHSHVNSKVQVDLGLQGILIVDYDDEPFYYDYDNIIVLDDVKLNSEGEHYPFNNRMEVMHGRFGNILLVNGNASQKIDVYNNSILRLRLINTANARTFNFNIEGKKMIVIGKDIGLIDKPYTADFVTLSPGERYDVIVILNNETKNTLNLYNINRRGYTKIGYLNIKKSNLSLIKSQSEIEEDFTHKDEHTNYFGNDTYIEKYDFSKYLDVKENMTMYLEGIRTSKGLRWTINGKTHPENTEIFNMKKGYFYKMKIINTQGQPHPMHLHGQKFKVLKRNNIPTNDSSFKDTVVLNGFETVEIGLIPEELGNWVFHCHILEHVDAGMLSIVKVY